MIHIHCRICMVVMKSCCSLFTLIILTILLSRHLGGTVHFDGRLVRVVSRGLGGTSLSSRGASSLSPLPAQQTQYFTSGTASIPMHSPLTWRPSSAPDSSTGTPYSPLHHFPRTKGGWIQGQQHAMEGHSQQLSLTSTSAAGAVNADLWRAMAAEDATRLGQGIGNIRISESPRLASKKRSVATGWESSGWPATPGSAGGKRKSIELGGEYEREGGNIVDSSEGDGGSTPLRKLRTMTPKKAHASIVGFGQTGGSAPTSAGGSNYYANHPGAFPHLLDSCHSPNAMDLSMSLSSLNCQVPIGQSSMKLVMHGSSVVVYLS